MPMIQRSFLVFFNGFMDVETVRLLSGNGGLFFHKTKLRFVCWCPSVLGRQSLFLNRSNKSWGEATALATDFFTVFSTSWSKGPFGMFTAPKEVAFRLDSKIYCCIGAFKLFLIILHIYVSLE